MILVLCNSKFNPYRNDYYYDPNSVVLVPRRASQIVSATRMANRLGWFGTWESPSRYL